LVGITITSGNVLKIQLPSILGTITKYYWYCFFLTKYLGVEDPLPGVLLDVHPGPHHPGVLRSKNKKYNLTFISFNKNSII